MLAQVPRVKPKSPAPTQKARCGHACLQLTNPSVVGAETGTLLGLAVHQSSSSFSELPFLKSKAGSDRTGYLTSFLGPCKHVFSYSHEHTNQTWAHIPKCNLCFPMFLSRPPSPDRSCYVMRTGFQLTIFLPPTP